MWGGVNYREDNWQEKFQQLVAYKEKHGDCNVPQRDGHLDGWVNVQRMYCDKDSEHGKQLSAIGFCWNILEASWQDKFDLLVAYQKERGHCLVPQRDGDLGGWVNAQRKFARKILGMGSS